MRHRISLSTFLLLAWTTPHHAMPASPAGQCLAQEVTYFSCDTSRHKTISLCGIPQSTLQYRYGTPPHTELAFPDKPSDGLNLLRYAHYFRAQTERTEVTFSHTGTDYAVFDYTDQGKRSAGVHVTLPDGTEHEVLCASPIQGHLSTLQKMLRCDADNALNGGNCP